MSVSVRHLYNEEREFYYYRNAGVDPVEIKVCNTVDEIPPADRHFAEGLEKHYCDLEFARWLGIADILYPDFPKCGHSDYYGLDCIGGKCKFCGETMAEVRKCKYLQGNENC